MIEWRALVTNPVVTQSFQERDKRRAIGGAQVLIPDPRAQVAAGREVAAARVKVDYLLQRALPAVVRVRPCELHVPQAGRLEKSLYVGLRIGSYGSRKR